MFNIVKVQEEGEQNRILFSNGEEYVLASYSKVFDPEVLLFKSNVDGEVKDWVEIFGEKHEYSTEPRKAIFSTVDTYNKVLEGNNYNGAWAQ